MASLSLEKCLNHSEREAAARCPRCRSNFCRECVSEHQSRILCATCLAASAPESPRQSKLARYGLPLGALAGLAMAWLAFFTAGKGLLLIPPAFHDGTWTQPVPAPTGPTSNPDVTGRPVPPETEGRVRE
jgi:hypothetical protein